MASGRAIGGLALASLAATFLRICSTGALMRKPPDRLRAIVWFENGDLAEIFLNTCKHGTAVDVNARDAAIAASLLLQHGCHVDTLRKALTRNSDGSASGPLARALDLLGQA